MRTSSSISAAALLLPALSAATGTHGPKPCPKAYVSSHKLQNMVKLDDLLAGANKLQSFADANQGTRVFGSGGHKATVDWIYDTLTKLGTYDVVKQPFTEIYFDGTATFSTAGAEVEAQIMTYSPAGTAEDTEIVAVANLGCEGADFPVEVAGKIALISRGVCPFAQKSINAKAAGAAVAIVYNNIPEGVVAGTLGDPFGAYAPVFGISQADGQAILDKIAAGETVTGTAVIDAITEERVTHNVIAETKDGDHDNVLIVGGHSDSVAAGPGINDDGSGIIGVLNVAIGLSKFKVKNAVRFGFWSAEEFGLLGSEFYVKSINTSETELAKIRAYLNFDMIASPNYVYGIYDGDGNAFNLTGPDGSDVIEKDFEDFYTSKGVNSVPTAFSGRSDYAAFIENGIPAGGVFTGAEDLKTEEEVALFGGEAGVAYDVNYHQAGDTVDNLNLEAFLINTKAIANSVAKYALSWDSLPAVNLLKRRVTGDKIQWAKRATHGHAHDHTGPCGGNPSI